MVFKKQSAAVDLLLLMRPIWENSWKKIRFNQSCKKLDLSAMSFSRSMHCMMYNFNHWAPHELT